MCYWKEILYLQTTCNDLRCPFHTLTGYSGCISQRVHYNKSVLQAAPPNSLGSNQNQRFPLKRRHLGYFFIDLQLITVKFCSKQYKAGWESYCHRLHLIREPCTCSGDTHLHSSKWGTSFFSSFSSQFEFRRASLRQICKKTKNKKQNCHLMVVLKTKVFWLS